MQIYLLPVFIGLFGWLLVWALVKLLFYPIHPITIGTIQWQGFLHQWIRQIELNKILPQFSQGDSFESLKPVINEKLDDFFKNKLSAKMPMISMFIGEKTIEELKGVFMEELETIFPLLLVQFTSNLDKKLQNQWQTKFSMILLKKVISATYSLRWIAFLLGFIWGILVNIILY